MTPPEDTSAAGPEPRRRASALSKHLQRDLEALQKELLSLATLVEEAIYKAIRALQDRDAGLAREVVAGDAAIDDLENRIDEDALKIIALHQPVATDLRRIAVAFMLTTDLERMGDLAVDIAERAIALTQGPQVPVAAKLQRMTDLTALMVRQVLDAFVNLDSAHARRVIRLDDEVDELNDAIIQDLLTVMRQSPELVEPALSLFSATRHLERIADHATNIAEDVVYLVEGELLRHKHAAGE